MLLTLFVITIVCFALAYKFYGGFQSRYYGLDPERTTPATELQDMLGFLHDDYVNDMLVGEIMKQYPDDAVLQYEGAMFCGWERAKAEAALASLPSLWDNFTAQLGEWQDEHL